jgi:hypothetical protein
MNQLIVLPGNSIKNKAWGELMLEKYGSKFDSSWMLSYDHWDNGETNIDFECEEKKIHQYVSSLPTDAKITIFAKSAGSLLAFLAIYHHIIIPARCVFFGIPFDLAANNHFKDSWEPVKTFKVSAIAFHNVDDPTAGYEFTKNALAKYSPHTTLITTYEADHWYGDTETYNQNIFARLV